MDGQKGRFVPMDLVFLDSKGKLCSIGDTMEYRATFMEYPSNLIVDWSRGMNWGLKWAYEATELDKEYY